MKYFSTCETKPFFHGHSNRFLDDALALQIGKDFPHWDDPAWETFDSPYGFKKELSNRELFPPSLLTFLSIVESDEFIHELKEATGLELEIDLNLFGGGLNIYPPNSRLQKHTDFNYNNDLKKYRALNLLYFVNENYDSRYGGELILHGEGEKAIQPILNSALFFVTNNRSVHEVLKTNEPFYRKSISLWYYTKECPPHMNPQPHKTNWL